MLVLEERDRVVRAVAFLVVFAPVPRFTVAGFLLVLAVVRRGVFTFVVLALVAFPRAAFGFSRSMLASATATLRRVVRAGFLSALSR